MAKKRLILDVNEATHTRLKSEAAQLGIALGSHCARILEQGGELSSPPAPVELNTAVIATMPLNTLRDMSVTLANSRPEGWERKVGAINLEIRRRYRV